MTRDRLTQWITYLSAFIIIFLVYLVLFSIDFSSKLPDHNCRDIGIEVMYLLGDTQPSFMQDGRCYYPVLIRLGNGNMIRVPVETSKIFDSVRTR